MEMTVFETTRTMMFSSSRPDIVQVLLEEHFKNGTVTDRNLCISYNNNTVEENTGICNLRCWFETYGVDMKEYIERSNKQTIFEQAIRDNIDLYSSKKEAENA